MSALTMIDLAAKIPQMLGTTAGQMASNLPDALNGLQSSSLSEFASIARYAPTVIVDGLIAKDPIVTDVLKVINQLSSIYYLQSISLMMKHNGTHIADILDSLNPNRDVGRAIAKGIGTAFAGNEDYNGYALPNFDVVASKVATTATPFDYSVVSGNEDDRPLVDTPEPMSAGLHKDTMNTISTMNNVAIGTVVDVVFESKDGKMSIPIQFSVRPKHTPSRSIIDILSHAEKDISLKERTWQYKNDLISLSDLITCADLIDEHRKALRRDTTGIYAEMVKRKSRNRFVGFLSVLTTVIKGARGRPLGASVASAACAYVLDKSTAQSLEYAVGGKLSDFRLRSRIFANSLTQFIVVVDTAWNSVTIYHRGEELETNMSSGDLKASGGKAGSGSDMLAMLEAFNKGSIYNQARF